jgi:hypothetical protein
VGKFTTGGMILRSKLVLEDEKSVVEDEQRRMKVQSSNN